MPVPPPAAGCAPTFARRRPATSAPSASSRGLILLPASLAAARAGGVPWSSCCSACWPSSRPPTSPSRSSIAASWSCSAPTAAAARAPRGRPATPADPGGGADAADDRAGDRGADRAPGGPLPRQSGRRPPLRAPLRLDGRARGDHARRRRAAGRRRRGDRARSTDGMGPAAGRRARFLLFHRRRVWNEGEGLDGLGAQARQAARAEPLLRGATDTTFRPRGRHPASRRRPLRDHARRRHAAAAGGRPPAGRHDGAPAQPPALRRARGRVVEGYGVLQPRVTPTLPAGREARSSSASSPGPAGIDPYARRGLRRLPGPLRRGLATPARASTTSTPSRPALEGRSRRTRCSATTCSRASSRAPAW